MNLKINMLLYISLKSGEVIEIEGYNLLDKVKEMSSSNGWVIIDGYIIREDDISYMNIKVNKVIEDIQ